MGIEIFLFAAAMLVFKAEEVDQKVELQNQVEQLQEQVTTE